MSVSFARRTEPWLVDVHAVVAEVSEQRGAEIDSEVACPVAVPDVEVEPQLGMLRVAPARWALIRPRSPWSANSKALPGSGVIFSMLP